MITEYPEKIATLPITPYLDEICTEVKKSKSQFLVLTAETAAGKSTAMPVALLKHFPGKVVMLEPRRLAVLNIASRVSQILDEEVGLTAGYQIHLENKISDKTRFIVLTEAILTRKIQSDPLLEGISVVVIDEFHERSIHADLALAFLKEAIQMRKDLYVIVMSATIDVEKITKYLSAPYFHVPGRQYPVAISYEGNMTPSQAILHELAKKNEVGAILVFLPGIAEIRKTKNELEQAKCDSPIFILHSSISFLEQKKILQLNDKDYKGKRVVILSSAIAETSLTVPGITVVIDSGLSRVNSFNRSAGMETLVTRNESVFNAEQRAGRAGRIGPGRCIRLWNETDVRTTEMPPEIVRTDLTSLVLECAEWGIDCPDKLSWLDEPPSSSWNDAGILLEQLGCVRSENVAEIKWKITPLGKAVLSVGLHPRLACVAISGIYSNQLQETVKLAIKYSSYAAASAAQQKAAEIDLMSRVGKNIKGIARTAKPVSQTRMILSGFPDRIAQLCINTKNAFKDESYYQFPSGRVAALYGTEHPEYIVAPKVDAGEKTGKIYEWEKLTTEEAEDWLNAHASTSLKIEFNESNRKLQKIENLMYGKLIVRTKKISVEKEDYTLAIKQTLAEKGIDWLPLSDKSKNLLLRIQFYIAYEKECADKKRIENKFTSLSKNSEEWLLPFITSVEKGITEELVSSALEWYLESENINKKVPQEIKLSNGKTKKIVYERQNDKIIPVMEVIIQQVFGCMTTPKILGIPVLFKLLSPAKRPLQITDDLENFWKNTWPEICKEMKGRYPKHNWDYKIISLEE